MSGEDDAAAELRAMVIVHGEMLRQLWIFTLGEHSTDPVDDADACRSLALDALEDSFDAASNPSIERLRQTAITKMEDMWTIIMAGAREYVDPIDVVPTAYGQRLAGEDRTRKDSQPGDDTPDQ